MAEPEHLSKTEARSGTGPGAMKYVLGISLILVVAALAIILLVGFR